MESTFREQENVSRFRNFFSTRLSFIVKPRRVFSNSCIYLSFGRGGGHVVSVVAGVFVKISSAEAKLSIFVLVEFLSCD